jgi:hypothetical protein
MSNLKSKVSVLVVCLLFSVGLVHAAKPVGDTGSKVERSESFWGRWFGRSEKVERSDDTDKVKDKNEKQSNRYFSDLERSRIEDYYRRDSDAQHGKKDQKNKKKQVATRITKEASAWR